MGRSAATPSTRRRSSPPIFGKEANQVPADAQEAYQQSQQELEPKGQTAFQPTPFADANALGMLKTKADELGVTKISDLQGKSQDLTLYGSPGVPPAG